METAGSPAITESYFYRVNKFFMVVKCVTSFDAVNNISC